MPSASLTRRISFSAAHRYSRPEWTEEKNASTFGACAWKNFHGHTYVCDITITGPIDPKTGFVVDLGLLDRILKEQVKDRFDHRNINLDVESRLGVDRSRSEEHTSELQSRQYLVCRLLLETKKTRAV